MRHGVARLTGAAAVVAAAAVLGACGGDDDDGGGAATGDADLTVVAQDSLTFDEDSYTAPAGVVEVGYQNGGNLTHTLLVEGVDADDFRLTVGSSGDTDSGTVDLEAGEYRIYCDVPGHSGMEATLTVE